MISANNRTNVDMVTNNMLKELPFYLIYRMTTTQFHMNFHSHEGYELYFLLEGGGHYVSESRLYPLQGCDLIMIDQNEIHKTAPKPGETYTRTIINFLPEFVPSASRMKLLEMFGRTKPESRHLVLHAEQHRQMNVLLDRIHEEYTARETGFEEVLRIYLHRLLMAVYRIWSEAREPGARGVPPVNSKVEGIIRYLSDHYAEDIVLSDLAKRFYLDPYYLCHLFKRTTGETVRQYLQYTRIHHAKHVLLTTDSSIAEVAKRVGFNNSSYFTAIFKRQEGITPQQFRKRRP